MSLPPPPARDINPLSQPWLKWFTSVYKSIISIDTTNDIIIDTTSKGLVLKDTAGHYWRVKISTGGALTTTDLGTTKP